MHVHQITAWRNDGTRFEIWLRHTVSEYEVDEYCQELIVKYEYNSVELQHLNIHPNYPGCMPRLVSRISRLDMYDIRNNQLTRTTCNIF